MHSFFAEDLNFANIGLQNADVAFYTVTDSTNTRAREAFLKSPDGAPKLYVAEEQTAGRGTRGRSFESREGGLYFSYLFVSKRDCLSSSRLTPLAAAAVWSALSSMLGRESSDTLMIKWVNDVFLGGKKISGILSERIEKDGRVGVIVGIGINLYGSPFSPEVKKIAASVEELTGKRLDKPRLLYEILCRLIPAISEGKKNRLSRIYRKHGLKRGASISVTDSLGKEREARVIGLDRSYRLRVKYTDGERAALISGDVKISL